LRFGHASQRPPAGLRRRSGREHHAHVRLGDVHGTALATARADGAAHHLAVDLFQRNAFADQIVQPAVGRHQLVVCAKRTPIAAAIASCPRDGHTHT